MAKLFSKDYHEKSSTWFFNHVIIPLDKGDVLYWKSLDEKDLYHLHFFPAQTAEAIFPTRVDIVYDPQTELVVSHRCSECERDENCRHYLSILRFAYNFLTTDIFAAEVVETCFGDILSGAEDQLLSFANAIVEVEGIFNPNTDKVRFYLGAYEPLDIFAHLQEPLLDKSVEELLTEAEWLLFHYIYEHRAAYSQKGVFISIYKKDFAPVLTLLKAMSAKVRIKESGDRMDFVEHPYQLSLRIEPLIKDRFLLFPVIVDELSVWYCGNPTWLFFQNRIYQVNLPFQKQKIEELFNRQLLLSAKDLIYYRAIVHKQLLRCNIYLDFAEGIVLPQIIADEPKIHLVLSTAEGAVFLEGYLKYPAGIDIPLAVTRFKSSLIRASFTNGEGEQDRAWFYISPSIFKQVKHLLSIIPQAEMSRLEDYSQLVFSGDDSIKALQEAIFSLGEKDWEIEIAEQLKQSFVQRVALEVEIEARSSEEIDWFSYAIRYRYKDYLFTHEELSHYFKSGERFLKTRDGRMVFIANPEVFGEAENLVQKSQRQKEEIYRARLSSLPYYMQLRQINPAFTVSGDELLMQMFNDILERKTKRTELLPQYLSAIMRGYQKAGFAWLKMLEHYHLGGVLADEMGLGKTLQALSVISESPMGSISLVICPKTLVYNWAAEIEKFHTNIPYAIVEGGKKERSEIIHNPNIRLLIISYSMATNELSALVGREYHWLILDEAQNIKNVSTQRSTAIKKLKAKHKLALSGTPIENRLSEIWSIFDFLMPGYLGNLNRFKKDFPEEETDSRLRLNRHLSPFLLRRTKKEVLLELPDKQEQVSWCKMSPLQEKLYIQIIEQVKRQLFKPSDSEPNYIHILSALTRLRQICNHPALISDDIKTETANSAKLELLLELVSEAIQNGHKILVFSQFVQMLKLIKACFDAQKVAYAYLDGQSKDRQQQIDRFNTDKDIRLFLISLKTGGVGINLTAADTVILFDPWWNPMIENQAIDRTHRLGQTQKVQVIRLITKDTVEEKILSLQHSKLDLFKDIVEDGQKVLQKLTQEDLKALFHYQP